jgi:hypothetical protein
LGGRSERRTLLGGSIIVHPCRALSSGWGPLARPVFVDLLYGRSQLAGEYALRFYGLHPSKDAPGFWQRQLEFSDRNDWRREKSPVLGREIGRLHGYHPASMPSSR